MSPSPKTPLHRVISHSPIQRVRRVPVGHVKAPYACLSTLFLVLLYYAHVSPSA